ncbi:FAD-dependent monooxygenase [Paraburkholderia sp. J63]|uniref:FAD-dependent monooxygenase n=1 Tax=Paraburkholderia sp. J63 TaxID=2805434 RepID=UPI002ABE2E7F|nr:FAD-dependent monooxygenase [Paraburkholderia sp. J63]
MNSKTEVPVIIVGGGPVGLALANELSWRGVEYVLVDEGDGDVAFPAGEAIFSRTMEHLRRWGIADRVRHHPGFPDDYPFNVAFATSLHGKLLASFDGHANRDMPTAFGHLSPEGPTVCPKRLFDPTLRDAALERGADLRYGVRATLVSHDSDGVSVELADLRTGRVERVKAGYLAACDGARSAVRKALEIDYEGDFAQGHNFAAYFRSPGLKAHLARQFGSTFFQIHTLTPQRTYLTTVDGSELWRISEYCQADQSPDPADMIRRAIGEDIGFDILRAQPWSGHRVVARHYGAARVFLVGDAAHLRWPKGGFGANTGIGDAIDLGWKIAAHLAGWGGDGLLESYGIERRPIALRNTGEAARNYDRDSRIEGSPLLDADTSEGEAARRAMEGEIHRHRKQEFTTQGIQLGYRYAGSPICVPDGSEPPPDDPHVYTPTTWPGARAPHAWLAPGVSTLDAFGRAFVLVTTEDEATVHMLAEAFKARGVPFATLRITAPDVVRLYERKHVLVRPDGHVAWRGDELPENQMDLLDRICGRRTLKQQAELEAA